MFSCGVSATPNNSLRYLGSLLFGFVLGKAERGGGLQLGAYCCVELR